MGFCHSALYERVANVCHVENNVPRVDVDVKILEMLGKNGKKEVARTSRLREVRIGTHEFRV